VYKWVQDAGGTGPGVYGKSVRRRLSSFQRKYATVFQAEIYTILDCVPETETHEKPKKHVSICSESQVAKALKAEKQLVYQRQKVLNSISALHLMWMYWVPGHTRVRGNEIAVGLARCDSSSRFVGPQPALESLGRI
jgi:hypothetical protein